MKHEDERCPNCGYCKHCGQAKPVAEPKLEQMWSVPLPAWPSPPIYVGDTPSWSITWSAQ